MWHFMCYSILMTVTTTTFLLINYRLKLIFNIHKWNTVVHKIRIMIETIMNIYKSLAVSL